MRACIVFIPEIFSLTLVNSHTLPDLVFKIIVIHFHFELNILNYYAFFNPFATFQLPYSH